MMTPSEMATRSADLKIKCTGEIDNTKDTYIYVSVWDSPKGTDKVGDRENEITYMFLVRMVFWKTTHKQIWFATSHVCCSQCLLFNRSTGKGEIKSPQLVSRDHEVLHNHIVMRIGNIIEAVEIKDWWLNAFRSFITRKIAEFVKTTMGHRCSAYSVTTVDHTKLETRILESGNVTETEDTLPPEPVLPKHEKGVIHNSEFDYSEHFSNPPTLCDLTISPIR